MKKNLNEYKVRTLFSCLLTLVPIIIGIIEWGKIPNSLLTNSSITTQINTPIYKILLVFGIPILLTILNLICLSITFKDNNKAQQNKRVLNSLFYICPAISIISSITFYNGILGYSFNQTRIVPFIIGLIFILLGNNLPKVKPNSTYGIKTYWALKNNENWVKTHKISGYVWVIGGLLILFLPTLPLNYIIPIMIGIILLCVVIPVSYSYFYYKKQVQNNEYEENGVLPKSYTKKQKAKIFIVVALTLVAIFTITVTGNIDTTLQSDCISVDASYYTDIEIPYDNIEHIEYREHKNVGTKLAGFNSFSLSLGTFENKEFGNYTCYVYNNTKSCIAIKTNNGNILINEKNDELTNKLYKDLEQKIYN